MIILYLEMLDISSTEHTIIGFLYFYICILMRISKNVISRGDLFHLLNIVTSTLQIFYTFFPDKHKILFAPKIVDERK